MEYKLTSEFDATKNTWLVRMYGEIDIYNSTEFKKSLQELLKERSADVSLDCSNLEYIDSTGLGALVAILKVIREANNKMYLNGVKNAILKLFRITDLDKVFIINGVNYNDAE